MKNLLRIYILFFVIVVNAQFTDDMESYTDGATIYTGHWTDWNGNNTTPIYASSTHAYSGSLSGYIPPNATTDALLDLGNQTTGNWGIKFMMYIPSNREADMNIQALVPITGGFSAIGDIYFNKDNNAPGVGYVKYNSSSSSEWSYFQFPHDQWFEVIINVHINNNWQLLINGNVEIDWEHYGRWVSAGNFNYSNKLGGIDFFSRNTNTEFWIDDINFTNSFQTSSITDFSNDRIVIFPNPVTKYLNIKFLNNISLDNTIKIFSTSGSLVMKTHAVNNIDISSFPAGIYFVIVNDNLPQKIVIKK